MTAAGWVLLLIIAGLVIWWILALVDKSQKASHDKALAKHLDERIQGFLAKRSALLPTAVAEVREYKGLRLGEVTRHFDAGTQATISGWMTHDLGFHGWGVGGSVGRVGLATGSIGLRGVSDVNLSYTGTTRNDLMGDGFIAVFEEDTTAGIDTLRVVVPSEQQTREWAQATLEELANRLTKTDNDGKRKVVYPASYSTLGRRMAELLTYTNEGSYVSDRLHSVLRMAPESRPRMTVYGQPLSSRSVLAGAIQIDGDNAIHPLFPLALFREVPAMIEKLLNTPAAELSAQ